MDKGGGEKRGCLELKTNGENLYDRKEKNGSFSSCLEKRKKWAQSERKKKKEISILRLVEMFLRLSGGGQRPIEVTKELTQGISGRTQVPKEGGGKKGTGNNKSPGSIGNTKKKKEEQLPKGG